MWSHYADSFQGVCIGVDPGKMNHGVKEGGFKVDYKQPRRKRLAEELIKPEWGDDVSVKDIPCLTEKSKIWKYEKEVRFIYDLKKEEMRKLIESVDIGKIKIQGIENNGNENEREETLVRDVVSLPADAIRVIIFGVDVYCNDVKAILNLLNSNQVFEHVKLYISAIHSDYYKIQYMLMDRNEILDWHCTQSNIYADAKDHKRWCSDHGTHRLVYLKNGYNLKK
jgi:hypothetical protein